MFRYIKGNNKGFCKYISSQRKTRENREKSEKFFALVFVGNICLLVSHSSGTSGKVWSNEDLDSVGEDQAKKHLNKFAIRKSMGPNRMSVEGADVVAKPLSSVFERLTIENYSLGLVEESKCHSCLPEGREGLGIYRLVASP